LKRLTLANILVFILQDGQLNCKRHTDYIYEKLVKFAKLFYRLMSKFQNIVWVV